MSSVVTNTYVPALVAIFFSSLLVFLGVITKRKFWLHDLPEHGNFNREYICCKLYLVSIAFKL